MSRRFLCIGQYAINLENVAYIDILGDAAAFNFTLGLPEPLAAKVPDELRQFLKNPDLFQTVGDDTDRVACPWQCPET